MKKKVIQKKYTIPWCRSCHIDFAGKKKAVLLVDMKKNILKILFSKEKEELLLPLPYSHFLLHLRRLKEEISLHNKKRKWRLEIVERKEDQYVNWTIESCLKCCWE